MPWTVGDVDKHKKGLTAKQKRQWVAVANGVLRKCMADGGTEATCAASAIRQANGVAGNEMVIHTVKVNDYQIREERHQGRNTVVVPVVMMVEGVHSGSHGPLLHPADELGRFIQTWNGIPVVIQHPQRDGVNISANDPEVIDGQTVGRVYNAHMDGPKLKAEAWIDVERIQDVSPESLALIRAQLPLDVSVGVFSEDDLTPGDWNGEAYIGVARGHRPDHLALLPGGTGACSWADGCGVRANAKEGGEDEVPEDKLKFKLTLDTDQANQDLDSLLEKATILRSVIEGNEDDLEDDANCGGGDGSNKKKKKKAQPVNQEEDEGQKFVAMLKGVNAKGYALSLIQTDDHKQGYLELLSKVRAAVDGLDNNTKVHFLEEVFDGEVVYAVMSRENGQTSLYRQAFEVNDKGEVRLTGSATPVVRQVQFVNVNNNSEQGGKTMPEEIKKKCCPEKVQALIASEHTPFEEADKEWLESLDQPHIDKLVAMELTMATKPEPAPAPAPVANEEKKEEPVTSEKAVAVVREQYKTADELIANVMPEEMREAMTSGLALHNAERTRLIETVKAANVFSEDELKTKTMAELGKLAKIVKPQDYSGLRGGSPVNANEEEVLLPMNVLVNQEGGKK